NFILIAMHPNTILRYCIYIGLFVTPFIFFIVPSSLLFPFITGKAFTFRIIVEIIFGLWLVLILRDKEYSLRLSPILKALSLFIFVVLLADILAVDAHKAFWSNYERMEGFMALIHLFAYFLVAGSILKTKEIWNKFLTANVAASAIMAVYSFFQLAGKITIHQGGVRVDGSFGNASYLGIYMVFNIFFASILFLNSRAKLAKYILGGVALVDLIVLYYTATRGAILGFLGGALIVFAYLAIKAEKGQAIRKAAGGFLVLLILGAGVFWLAKNTAFVKNSPILSRFATLSFSEIKTQGRYFVWPMAWKGVVEKPILGWGQEGFNYVFNKYYDPRMYTQEPWFDRTHDIFLDWLVNTGALGLLSYLSIFAALLYAVRKSGEQLKKEEKAILYGLSFAYFFHNIFVFDQIGSYILFFSVLAFVHSQNSREFTGRLEKGFSKLQSVLGSGGTRPITDSVIVILILSALYFVNYIPWKQNANIITALKVSAEGALAPLETYEKPLRSYNMGFPEALEHVSGASFNAVSKPEATEKFKQDLFSVIDSGFKKHLERAPYDVRHRIFYSIFLSRFGLYEQSITQLEEAAKYSPSKQSIYMEMGSQLILSGKIDLALEKFKKAYELEPNYEEARFAYGMGAIYAKKFELANQLLQGIQEQKIIFDDRYIGALFSAGLYNDVVATLNKRIAREPVNTQHKITLASVYLQIGMREAAVTQLQEIIKIDPSFKEKGEYYIGEIRAGRNP
ncbi:MAG: tetratricopeptide repeat protein, partial [Patescibacteria group bacterium]